ncbi:MAG: amidohydrolase family protein [Bacteroidales bacterium]|nr:amidohydrolase family protein [Bacteroidales bacterium]MCF8454387.1 amidohydrolase family protein [Bacteroidales bacterium]
MAILLKNATYIDWQSLEFILTNILVEEGETGKIRFLNPGEDKKAPSDIEIDCTGKYVTKSFAVGHHHVYSALARGMPAPKKTPSNFKEILEFIWWTLDKALDKDMIRVSALATAIACAKAGSTFMIDHHASPNCIEGSLEIIAQAFDEVGLGHLLCYEISDRDGLDKAGLGLIESEKYLKKRQGLVGLHASFTLGDNTLKKAADLMSRYNSGVHIHVAEDEYDEHQCLEVHHKWVVDRLSEFGFLDSSKTILGHCLHLDEYERAAIKDSKAWVVQNTESNLNNNVGYFSSKGLGERIFMGTDGMHSDMLQSVKAAFLVGQGFDKIGFASAYQRFRNVHHYLKENKFSGDGENNLVVLDYDSPTEFNQNNFLGHFIYGLNSNHIQHVISKGKLVVKDRQIQTVNESEILAFSKEQSLRLWEKMKS